MNFVTASQTVGPFFAIGMSWLKGADLTGRGVKGKPITIEGRLLDGSGAPVPDGVLEVWQADPRGRFGRPEFPGFARVPTDAQGTWRFTTVKPGAVVAHDGTLQAPHIVLVVFARGLLHHLVTRIYFPGDPANRTDAALQRVPADRRATLMARAVRGDSSRLRFDVVLRGEVAGEHAETVFFELA